MSFSLDAVLQSYRAQIAHAEDTAKLTEIVAHIAETFERPMPTQSWDEEGHQYIGSDRRLEREYATLLLCAAERWEEVVA